jgi:hypothetical protein
VRLWRTVEGTRVMPRTIGYAEGEYDIEGIDIADIRLAQSVRGSGLDAAMCTFTDHCEPRPTMVRVTGFKASPR